MATLYVRKDGRVFGPLEVEKIAEALNQGQIGPQDEVSKDGLQWHPVAKVSGQILAAAAKPAAPGAPRSAAPPPPPPPPPRPQSAAPPARPAPPAVLPMPLPGSRAAFPPPAYAPPAWGAADPSDGAPRRTDLRYSGALGVLLGILLGILCVAWFGIAAVNVNLSLKTKEIGEKLERSPMLDSRHRSELLELAEVEKQNTSIVMAVMGATLIGLTLLVIWHVRNMVLARALGPNHLGISMPMIIVSYLIPPLNFIVPALGLKQLWKSAQGPGDASQGSGTTAVTIWAALRFCGFAGTVVMAVLISQAGTSVRPGMDPQALGRIMVNVARYVLVRAATISLFAVSIGILVIIVMRIERSFAERVKREAV